VTQAVKVGLSGKGLARKDVGSGMVADGLISGRRRCRGGLEVESVVE